jgi:F-box/leucine-rich repeat protein 2/20
LPSLLSLNLQSCSLLDDATLLPLSSSSPYLTSLTLSGCSLVSDPSLLAIASRLSYLQALGLAYTQVSSVGLTALAKGVCAKVLKELDLSHCERVRDDGVLCLLSHCPSLSILILHGCPLLTSLSRDIASRGHKIKQVTWTVY